MRAAPLAAGLLLAAAAGGAHAQAGPEEVRRLVAADRYTAARTALRAWWTAAGDTATGNRRASGIYLRAVLADSLPAAERDLLRVTVEHPLAPEADDALLRLAHLRLLRRDSAGAAAHLERLASDFPQSPLRPSGLSLLGRIRRTDARVASSPAPAAAPPARVAAAPPRAPVSAARQPAGRREAGRFTVEVAAERSATAAAGTREALRARGISAFLVMDGDDASVRVRVGSYPSRDAANAMAERLRQAGYTPAVVPAAD